MNDEQMYWSEQMSIRLSAYHTSLDNLKFFEERLGVVNSVVIDFRKHIETYHKKFVESQIEFEMYGGIEYCMKQL